MNFESLMNKLWNHPDIVLSKKIETIHVSEITQKLNVKKIKSNYNLLSNTNKVKFCILLSKFIKPSLVSKLFPESFMAPNYISNKNYPYPVGSSCASSDYVADSLTSLGYPIINNKCSWMLGMDKTTEKVIICLRDANKIDCQNGIWICDVCIKGYDISMKSMFGKRK